MKRIQRSRFLVPVAIFVGGTLVAAATALGSTWASAGTVELFVALAALGLFALGHGDSDVGAVFAHREDERQRVVRARAYALAMKVMYLAAFVCLVVAIAVKENYWQADVVLSCGGVAFVVGLRLYGVEPANEHEASDDLDVSNEALRH